MKDTAVLTRRCCCPARILARTRPAPANRQAKATRRCWGGPWRARHENRDRVGRLSGQRQSRSPRAALATAVKWPLPPGTRADANMRKTGRPAVLAGQ